MIEIVLLISLAAAAAVTATYHNKPGTRIRTRPVRMLQVLLWGHAPAFTGFFLVGLADTSNVFLAVVATAGAVVYGGSYAVLSYSDAFKRWPYYLVTASLGISLVLFVAAGSHNAGAVGRAGVVLVHAALYHYVVADPLLEAT